MTQAQRGRPESAGTERPAARPRRPRGRRWAVPRRHLLDLQDEQGWWQGELETKRLHRGRGTCCCASSWVSGPTSRPRATGPAGSGPGSAATAPGLTPTRASQTYPRTVEAYVALRLAGESPDAYHMAQARGAGSAAVAGIPATRVFTRIWLALFGEWSWDDLPIMPPELIYLPSWFPLNVSDWAYWARQTIVPLTIVGARCGRSARCRSASASWRAPRPTRPPAAATPASTADARLGHGCSASWTVRCTSTTATVCAPRPLRAVRSAAIRRCADWIIARQEKGRLLGRHPAALGVLADSR